MERIAFYKNQNNLTSLENFQNVITEKLPLGIWIIDNKNMNTFYENNYGQKITENSSFRSIKGILNSKYNNISQNTLNFDSDEDNLIQKSEYEVELKVIGSHSLLNEEFNFNKRNYLSNLSRIIYNGKPSQMVIFTDITKINEINEYAIKDLEGKESTLACIAHDVRTPLNSIISMNEAAFNEAKDPQLKFKLMISHKSSKLLFYLITDFLDYYKLSKMNEIQMDKSNFPLKSLVNEVFELFIITCKSKGINLELSISMDPDTEIYTDELKLKRILINLISNAIKFTTKGSITIIVEPEIIENTEYIKFSVKDTGIGISQDDIPKIFQKFHQVEIQEFSNRHSHGIGLGLSISNEMVKLLNNGSNVRCPEIKVESQYGQGSTFSFLLPLNEMDEPNSINNSLIIENHRGSIHKVIKTKEYLGIYIGNEFRKFIDEIFHKPQIKRSHYTIDEIIDNSVYRKNIIMIVEDEETNILVMQMYTDSLKDKIVIQRNGKEAYEAFIKMKEHGVNISLIFMDINMPIMNGFESTKLIRKYEAEKKFTPCKIIALSGNSLKNDFLVEKGFDDSQLKPMTFKDFQMWINKHFV